MLIKVKKCEDESLMFKPKLKKIFLIGLIMRQGYTTSIYFKPLSPCGSSPNDVKHVIWACFRIASFTSYYAKPKIEVM